MGLPTILVQMNGQAWTREALTQACSEAKTSGARIVLVRMIPGKHVGWAATGSGSYAFTKAEENDIQAYKQLAAEHGVPLTVRIFEYRKLEQGILKAADELEAESVYALVPPSPIPLRRDAPLRHLEHELQEHHHEFHRVQVSE